MHQLFSKGCAYLLKVCLTLTVAPSKGGSFQLLSTRRKHFESEVGTFFVLILDEETRPVGLIVSSKSTDF